MSKVRKTAFQTYRAFIVDTPEIAIGGVCKFVDSRNNEVHYLMIHPDLQGRPTVSRVVPESIEAVQQEN